MADNSFLANRRHIMALSTPPPAGATHAQRHAYDCESLLRLLPGDECYVVWASALEFYLDTIVEMARVQYHFLYRLMIRKFNHIK